MTAKELRDLLADLPPDAPVFLEWGERLRPLDEVARAHVIDHGPGKRVWFSRVSGKPNAVCLRPKLAA